MAWRQLALGGTVWNVSLAAERRADTSSWQLVFAFRSSGPTRRAFWAPYPLESSSKTTLYAQAEKISDHELAALVAQHLR